MPGNVRREFELIIAGPEGWRSDETLRRLRTPAAGVRYLGYVPEGVLPGLTAGATAFAFPSLYEGFGLPVAQAMACGVPVVTSYGSSLEEVATGAAVLVHHEKPDEIAAAIERVVTSASLRRELGAMARKRAEAFHWDHCAERSLDFFHAVARN